MSGSRSYYIDNLRIFLISLVLLHHLAITYGAPGDWYYNESELDLPASIPMAMFVSTNQAFFMGMFFMISAMFITPSLSRKGKTVFIKDRLIRLGIPTLIFYFILNPVTIYLSRKSFRDDLSFSDFILSTNYWGWGPMWFVEALLYFTVIYVLFAAIGNSQSQNKIPIPGRNQILGFALVIGLISFIVRIWMPVGDWIGLVNFQLAHFPQYIALFIVGIIAHNNGWSEQITYKSGLNWFIFAQILIFTVWPALFLLGGVAKTGNIEPFMGGLHWQSLAYSLWEQLVAIALIIGLIGIFKTKVPNQNSLQKKMSAAAYSVYIIHPVILVLISTALVDFEIHPLPKFAIIAPLVLLTCFIAGHFIRQLPLARKIL